jgi:5S rRNA maturation endonuclease (ribonuclease M5)
MDFLAFLSYQGINQFQNSVIILNSVSLRKQALDIINNYHFSKIYLFLDNDDAGVTTKQFFIDHLKNQHITDKSNLYKGYKDFNQMTIEIKNDHYTKH